MAKRVLGADLGTGGCKLIVINRSGSVVMGAFEEYSTLHPLPGWSEQDPATWISAFRTALKRLVAAGLKTEELEAVAPCAPTHNAVLLDQNGHVLRPPIIWTDQRSAPQVARLQASAGAHIFDVAFQTVNCTWTLPQLDWVREHEPEVWSRVHRVLFTKDYLRCYLTGGWETDTVDMMGTLLADAASFTWSTELCGLIGLDPAVLPPVVRPTVVTGRVTSRAAAETGLPEGLPVVAGSSDSACEGLAAGVTQEGELILKLATAGVAFAFSRKPMPHPETLTYPYLVEGLWYSVGATNSAASSLRWLRDLFGEKEVDGEGPYKRLDRLAADVPVGAEGLLFHPYLSGERTPYWNPDLRASFVGATLRHGKGHFARAVLEGVAFSLRDCLESLSKVGLPGARPGQAARIVGGGARSPLWRRIAADVLELPLAQPNSPDAAYGAALLAGVGAGWWPDPRTAACACVRLSQPDLPDPDHVKRYRRLFRIYKSVQRHLASDCQALSEFVRS